MPAIQPRPARPNPQTLTTTKPNDDPHPPPSIETISQPSTTNADSCPDTEYLAKKHIAVKDTRLTPVLEKTGDHKLITFVEDSQ